VCGVGCCSVLSQVNQGLKYLCEETNGKWVPILSMLPDEQLMFFLSFNFLRKSTIKVDHMCNLRILQHSRDRGTETLFYLKQKLQKVLDLQHIFRGFLIEVHQNPHSELQVTCRQRPYISN